MNIDSDDWQVMDSFIFKLFNDKAGQRCNEFTIQVSGDTDVTLREKEDLAQRITALLNEEKKNG